MASNWNSCCLLLLCLIGAVRLRNVAAVANVTLTSSIEFGRNDSICPEEIVEFNCIGVELTFLRWSKNEVTIITYVDDMELNNPLSPLGFSGITVVLTSIASVGQRLFNFSSTLSVNTSLALSPGDNITCGDSGFSETVTADYQFQAPPAIPDYIYSVGRGPPDSNTVNLTISLNKTFLIENTVERYRVYVDEGVVCPLVTDLSPNETYTCNGLRSGDVYNVRLRSVNCETQYGEETNVLTLTPQIPPPLAECESYPVYNQSNGVLTGIISMWNELQNVMPLSVGVAQDPEYYIISYSVISSATPTRVSVRPDGACNGDGMCRFIVVMNQFDRGTQYAVEMSVSNIVGTSREPTVCNNAIRSQNSIITVSSSGPSTIGGNSTIRCGFESITDNITRECVLCYSTRSGACGPENEFICRTIVLTGGDEAAVFDEIPLPYSSPEGPYGPFCYQVTARIDGVNVAMVTGEAFTGCTPYSLGTEITPEIDERCSSLNINTTLEASINGENGIYCYEGTLQGSRAHLICDPGYMIQEGALQAVCQRDGSWESIPVCVEGSTDDILELLNIILIAVGGSLWLVNAVLLVIGLITMFRLVKSKFNGQKRVWHFLFIFLLLLTLFLLLAAVGLWVAFGVIVGLYQQDITDVEERKEFKSLRDILCIAAFVVSSAPLLIVLLALLMYLSVPKCLSSSGSMSISDKTKITEFRKPENSGSRESHTYSLPDSIGGDHLENIEMSGSTTFKVPPPHFDTYPGQVPDVDS